MPKFKGTYNWPDHCPYSKELHKHSCTAEQLYNCTTVQLYNCTTVQLYNCTTVQLYNCTTVQLYNCTAVQMYNCTTVQLYSCTTVQLYKCTVVQQWSPQRQLCHRESFVQIHRCRKKQPATCNLKLLLLCNQQLTKLLKFFITFSSQLAISITLQVFFLNASLQLAIIVIFNFFIVDNLLIV